MAKDIKQGKKEAEEAQKIAAVLAARLKKAGANLKKASGEAGKMKKEWSAESDE